MAKINKKNLLAMEQINAKNNNNKKTYLSVSKLKSTQF